MREEVTPCFDFFSSVSSRPYHAHHVASVAKIDKITSSIQRKKTGGNQRDSPLSYSLCLHPPCSKNEAGVHNGTQLEPPQNFAGMADESTREECERRISRQSVFPRQILPSLSWTQPPFAASAASGFRLSTPQTGAHEAGKVGGTEC